MSSKLGKLTAAVTAGILGISCSGSRASIDENSGNNQLKQDEIKSGRVHLIQSETISGIVYGRDNLQFIGGVQSISAINPEGSIRWQFFTGNAVSALYLHTDGVLLAGIGNRIILINSDNGTIIRELPFLGDNAFISSLSVSSDGIFAADRNNSVVYRFSSTGRLLSLLGQNSPDGIHIPGLYFSVSSAGDGSVWISNPGHHRAEHYDISGEYIGGFGTAGKEGFVGCCNPICLLALSDGSVITGEKGIIRVRRFNTNGELLESIAGENRQKLDHLPVFLNINDGKLNIGNGKDNTIISLQGI